jgi:hypothetical protein
MIKLLGLLIVLAMAGLPAMAQEPVRDEAEVQQDDNSEPDAHAFNGRAVTPIDKEELPSGIQRMIATGEFRRWEVEEAYRIHGGAGRSDGQASYIVVVKRKEDRFALYYDADGRLIRQELMDFVETSSR